MLTSFLLLQYLLYMDPTIGLNVDCITQNCFAFKSGSSLRSCNRVCHSSLPSEKEIEEIKFFFAEIPFTWAVGFLDEKAIKLLEKNGLAYKASFPAMKLDLNSILPTVYGKEIIVEIIDSDSSNILDWIMIVSQVFDATESELATVINNFKKQIPYSLKLYLGFYKGKPVGAGMKIQHEKIASLHYIGTLQEFRNKGLGFAITHKALFDAKEHGNEQAILLTTNLGEPLYEHLGFQKYALYHMYGN